MKFKTGDKIDEDHCIALTHEFLCCDDAFKRFEYYASALIIKGKSKERSYRAYSAYANFIFHLYEFLLGCHARDAGNTEITNKKGEERTKIIDEYITHHTKRIMNNYVEAIEKGKAPNWVNDISYYKGRIPKEFASNFRKYRNKVFGHVTYERSSKLSLTDFYQKYHKFIYLLYYDAIYWWGKRDTNFPALKEITEFSLMLDKKNNKAN